MRILAWNCMGLEGPATISQLKESSRLYLPDIYFLCETKQSKGFVGAVSRKLRFGNRWDTCDPIGKKRGLMVAWKQGVEVKQLRKSDFCIEILVEQEDNGENLWIIFVYASIDAREKRRQWEWLEDRRQQWGTRWIIGGDFNDKNHQEKKGGNRRQESSFSDFRDFITHMQMQK